MVVPDLWQRPTRTVRGLLGANGAGTGTTARILWRIASRRCGRLTPMCPVLLVAGGSRGIGASTAVLAAERGYDVGTARRADVSVEADVLGLFAAVEQELGPIDGVVASAGIVTPQGRVETFSPDRVQRILGVNVLGSLLCAREAVRRMSTRHGGRGGPSCCCPRPRRGWGARGSTSTTPCPRGRWTR